MNLQHSKTASAVLQKQIAALEYAVILVQEPWTVNNNVAGLRTQHVSIYCGTLGEKPRTCVLVKGLSAYNMQQFGSRDNNDNNNNNGFVAFRSEDTEALGAAQED